MGFHHPVVFWPRLRRKWRGRHSQGFRRFARLFGRLLARHYRVSRPSYNRYEPKGFTSHVAEEEGVELRVREDGKEPSGIISGRAAALVATLACVRHGYMLLEVVVVVFSAGVVFTVFRLMDSLTPIRSTSAGRYPKDVLAATLLLILATLPMGLLTSLLTASCSWFVFSYLDHILELVGVA